MYLPFTKLKLKSPNRKQLLSRRIHQNQLLQLTCSVCILSHNNTYYLLPNYLLRLLLIIFQKFSFPKPPYRQICKKILLISENFHFKPKTQTNRSAASYACRKFTPQFNDLIFPNSVFHAFTNSPNRISPSFQFDSLQFRSARTADNNNAGC
jgi:hypothetical protein